MTSSSPWDARDRAAVVRIVRRLQDRDPDTPRGSLWSKAARIYFHETGRVASHSIVGYNTGCRCGKCLIARQRRRKKVN